VLSALIGALAIRKWSVRLVFFFFLAVGMTAIASDAYAFQAFPAIAGIPWLVRLSHDRKRLVIVWVVLAVAAGLCDLVRFHAGLPYIAMMVVMAFIHFPKVKAVALTLAITCLYLLPSVWFYRIYPLKHPDWHSVYIGLGWIPNSEVAAYQDHIGGDKVKSIDPSVVFGSPQYEAILRGELLKITKHKPWIIAGNLLAKTVAILFMLGILLVPVWKHLRFDLPFIVAIALGVLPGILVTPNPRYILAGLCVACFLAARTAIWSAPEEQTAQTAAVAQG
jgi:hypothetical protein